MKKAPVKVKKTINSTKIISKFLALNLI